MLLTIERKLARLNPITWFIILYLLGLAGFGGLTLLLHAIIAMFM